MESTTTEFERLSTPEKILWLQDRWDSIAETPEAVEVTEAQKREIDFRLAAAAREPAAAVPWNEVKASLRKQT